jgi:nucleotide-binding universal stress UspA family protein
MSDATDATALFARPLLPVADEDDAAATMAAALPHVAAAGGRTTVVFVVEKAGGAPDKASVEQREQLAEAAFAVAEERAAAAGVDVETAIRYDTDVADGIVAAAHDHDATAIVFTPRGGKWWWDLFSGDVKDALLDRSDLPVVMLPPADEGTATGDGAVADGGGTVDDGGDAADETRTDGPTDDGDGGTGS